MSEIGGFAIKVSNGIVCHFHGKSITAQILLFLRNYLDILAENLKDKTKQGIFQNLLYY